jgi:hypothetical protein
MIQDEITAKKPITRMTFFILGRFQRRMIQDEIVLKRAGPDSFFLHLDGGVDTRRDSQTGSNGLSSGI